MFRASWYSRVMLSKQKQTRPLTASGRRERRAVLLSGVVLNWAGAVKIARDCLTQRPGEAPADYELYKAFTAGTAATFGAFYLYLHITKKPVVPLLMFGASLKMWAFVLSAVLRSQRRLDSESFLSFGATNGLVGSLFWAQIVREARALRSG